ncbi:MFS general substrate transporter [Gymnopus androsaceus JB14]|uniref:MFS general substrate transporter n=1 Tax=Gymnopus androsaceus JB14 TaxID=1447944 RepID=A0A6A4I8J0_9AGAR|nr:MFS general substrate transporter [Gymnopus androsaceus JB14]
MSFATTATPTYTVNKNSDPKTDLHAGDSLSMDEFAVGDDTAEFSVSPIGIPKYRAASIIASTGANVDARRLSTIGKDSTTQSIYPYLSERTRRPSFIRADSAAETIISSFGKDENQVPATRTQTIGSVTGILGNVQQLQYEESPAAASQTTRTENRRSILHFVAVCWCFFLEGWNDGSVGPLLPVIQTYYAVGFAVVSLLFVFNCFGFIIGAGVNVWLNERIGFGKVMVLGSLFQLVTYAIQGPAPPFPAMVLSFFLAGFGMSLQSAQANGFVGSLKKNKSTKLMMLHASYGMGALCSPLVATQFSQTRHWSFHYMISAGIAVSNTAILCAVFRFKRQEGWIVTFIIRERDGGASAGYISSGFFGGGAYYRPSRTDNVNKKVGERKVVFFYMLLSIGLEITIWIVPSIIENAIAIACIGIFLGPMYPIMVGHGAQILPTYLFTVCMGWITGDDWFRCLALFDWYPGLKI